MVKIGVKEYYLADLDERNHAIKDINRLLTGPIMKKQGEEEEGSPPPEGGGAPPSLPSLPPLPDLPEPPEPEA